MRTEHWRRGDADRSTGGLGRSLGLALGAVALVAAAIYGFMQSRGAADARQAAEDEAAQIALIQTRVQLGWLHFDLMTDALAGAITTDSVRSRVNEFTAERNELLGDVRGLARLGGDVGPMAEAVLDVHDEADVTRWPIDAEVLDLLHYESMPFELTAGPLADRLGAHLDGVSVSMLPRLVLADALSIEMQRSDRQPPRWAAEYVDQTASIAIENPGWFGPARQSPMTNHVLIGPGDSDAVYRNVPAIVSAADSVETSVQRAWDYDQWLIAGDLDADAPLPIDELADEVDRIAAAFEAGFEAGMEEERAAILAAAPGENAATIWFMAAIVALAALALGLTVTMVRQWRRQRSLTQAVYIDGLTGAYNRRFLNEEVDGWCQRRTGHVAIAMVDLDRFKLVNDTWGHAVGDAVLTETARRLALAAAATRHDEADATSAVVRIGGDEFLMAWVGSHPFDPAEIERAVAGVAGPVDVDGGDPVPLELSVGIATAPTPTQLDDLMRAADLAVYAGKSSKRDAVRSSEPAPATDPA